MLNIESIRITYTITETIVKTTAKELYDLLVKDQDKLGVIIETFEYHDSTYIIGYSVPVTKDFGGMFRVVSSIERAIKKVYP
jgi:hypothetical protein